MSEAVTTSLYSLVFSLSRDEETVMRPTWNRDMRGVVSSYIDSYVHMLWVLVPYHGILDLEWDTGVTEGVCDFCICTLIPVSGYHGDDL